VQSFGRILRKVGARLASLRLTRGMASLARFLVPPPRGAHTCLWAPTTGFFWNPGFPRSWERIDRNGRERRSRVQREPGPGGFGRSSGARERTARVDRAHQRPPNSSSDVSYLLLPPSTNYKRGERGSNP
jgi:hypothetical protein